MTYNLDDDEEEEEISLDCVCCGQQPINEPGETPIKVQLMKLSTVQYKKDAVLKCVA
jgi:hypothetical protein